MTQVAPTSPSEEVAPKIPSKYAKMQQVCARYNRTKMTLHRWLKDPELKFPKPIRIRNHLYFVVAELDAFDRAMEGERV